MNIFFKHSLLFFLCIFFLTQKGKCQDTLDVGYTDFNVGCMFIGRLAPTYVINSEDEYSVLLNNVNNRPQCPNYNLPYINFSKYTLLGFLTPDGGCDAKQAKSVKIDELTKSYVYTITVTTEGTCKQLFQESNFILIPKTKEDYSVAFNKVLIQN